MVDNLGELVTAPSVYAPGFTLTEATKGDHEYPVDGWHWFATDDDAAAALLRHDVDPFEAFSAFSTTLRAQLPAATTIAKMRTALTDALDELDAALETP